LPQQRAQKETPVEGNALGKRTAAARTTAAGEETGNRAGVARPHARLMVGAPALLRTRRMVRNNPPQVPQPKPNPRIVNRGRANASTRPARAGAAQLHVNARANQYVLQRRATSGWVQRVVHERTISANHAYVYGSVQARGDGSPYRTRLRAMALGAYGDLRATAGNKWYMVAA